MEDEIAKSAILGIIQGITEFIPISSSGHLALFKKILNKNIENPLGFDISLHIGTTFSVLLVLWKDIKESLKRKEIISGVIIAFICTVPVALFFEGFAESVEENLIYLAISFFVGGNILMVLPKIRYSMGFYKFFFIGIMQGVSVVPGISRSGTTISASIFSGMNPAEAFVFSFILSIPTIISAIAYESFKIIMKRESFGIGFSEVVFGVISAFLFGCISLLILRRITVSGKLWIFGLYKLAISVFTLVYSMY